MLRPVPGPARTHKVMNMKPFRRLASPCLAGLVLLPCAMAWSATPATPSFVFADDGEEELQEILDDYQDAQDAFGKAYRAASTDAERSVVLREKQPDPQDYVKRIRAVAEKHPRTETAATGLTWIYTNTFNGADRKWALEVLRADHVESEAIGEVCVALNDYSPDAIDFFSAVIESNPHRSAQGRAKYGLADVYLALHEVATDGPSAGRFRSVVEPEQLEGLSIDGLESEFVSLLEELAQDYQDVPYRGEQSIGAKAEGVLFQKQRLQVGMQVPEIAAEDIEGIPFKLSDYRGKVVLIDFWGHW